MITLAPPHLVDERSEIGTRHARRVAGDLPNVNIASELARARVYGEYVATACDVGQANLD